PAFWDVVTGRALEAGRQGADAWIVDRCHFPNAYLAEGKGCGYPEWGGELGFHRLPWAPFGRVRPELIPVSRRIRRHDDLGNALPLVRGGQVELLVEGEGHVDGGMRAPTTGIGFKTDLLATKNASQTVGEFLQVITVRLVHRKKPIAPGEDVLGPSKTFARQGGREHATTRGLAGLQALGE